MSVNKLAQAAPKQDITGVKPFPGSAPTAAPAAATTPVAAGPDNVKKFPGTAAPATAPSAAQIPYNKNVARMQSEMLRIRSKFSIVDISDQKNKLNNPNDPNAPSKSGVPDIMDRHYSWKILNRRLSNSKNPVSISNILSNIDKSVGTDIRKVDGQWGGKTTAALNSIAKLAQEMVSLGTKFGVELQFGINEVEALKKLIPNNKEVNSTAEHITEILIRITDSTSSFLQTIDGNLTETSGHQELAGYEIAPKTKQEISAQFPDANKIQLTSKIFPAPINLANLLSKENLIKY